MKNFSFFFCAALAAIIITACGGQGMKSPNGYTYVNHTNVGGTTPKVGEYGFLHISVYQDDSLVNSTYQMGRTVPIMVPDLTQIPEDQKGVGKANPVSDVLPLMGVGDSVSVDVPIDSMMRQNPALRDAKKLTYAIVLKEVKTKEQYDMFLMEERKVKDEAAAAYKEQETAVATQIAGVLKDYKAGANKDKIKSTASGLKYLILEEGTGAQAVAGKGVDVMYYGVMTDGKMFDNSYGRGQAFSFQLGRGMVIKGWDEGIALLKEGGKAVLFIPSELAYGSQGQGSIPPDSELLFFVELQKVK